MATTIPEAVTTIPSGTLRLLLTSISYRAKARKEIRRYPSTVPRRQPHPCCWTAPPGGGCDLTADRCQVASRRAWEASRPRRADPVQVETLRLMVCPPTWRRWCICGLCGCCIVRAGIGQINGNATAKPCKRFWCLYCINCMDGIKVAVNACMGLYCSRAK